MPNSSAEAHTGHGGIQIQGSRRDEVNSARQQFVDQLTALNLAPFVMISDDLNPLTVRFELDPAKTREWAPNWDTAQISRHLNLNTYQSSTDLEREILVAMLMCPIPFQFPSYDELSAAVRIRRNIVQSARKTSLSFATDVAERPAEFWTYDDDRGFILRPGKSLIDALVHATQPEFSGQRFTFSCRRAGEYIVLLSIALEAQDRHPQLFEDLHRQAEQRAIKGREFERIFHRQIGSPTNSLPPRFFVPGDRTWFRNPEPISAEITGYEGSWTFYLGTGVYADFWRPGLSYDLTTKCVSIYHWRNSTFRDASGDLQIDENRVEEQMAATLRNPDEVAAILQDFVRLQFPLDTPGGGIVEGHRDCVCRICPGTTDLTLPDL